MTPESERSCLARLHEMDEALARMERELPDDVRTFGTEARKRVAVWLDRFSAGGVELGDFTEAMLLREAQLAIQLFPVASGPDQRAPS